MSHRVAVLKVHGAAILFGMLLICSSNCALSNSALSIGSPDPYCGPFALRKVLRYYNRPARMEDLIEAVYRPSLGGALISDMQFHARRLGFYTAYEESSIENLIYFLSLNMPVILLVRPGDRFHYYTATKYDSTKRRFLLTDAKHPDGISMAVETLRKMWEPVDQQLLLLFPNAGDVTGYRRLPPARSRVEMLLTHGAYRRACALLSRGRADASGLLARGECRLRLREKSRACLDFKAALAIAKSSGSLKRDMKADLHARLALCSLLGRDHAGARRHAKIATELRAGHSGAVMVLADIKLADKNVTGARSVLEKTLRSARAAERWEPALRLALLQVSLGNKELGRAYYKKALRWSISERRRLLVAAYYAKFSSNSRRSSRD